MRHAQAKVASAAIFEAEHVVAHGRPPPARLPQLPRMQSRQQELLPDLVHLLADDGDDLVYRALAEKKI